MKNPSRFIFIIKNNILNTINNASFIENGNFKKKFRVYARKQHLAAWVISIVTILFLSLLVMFIKINNQGQLLNNRTPLDLFKVNYETILQIWITGASLGASAYMFQRITKNRLVDTSTLGIGNVCLIGLFFLAISINFENYGSQKLFENLLPFIFIISGVCAGLILYWFSKKRTGFSHTKLIVSGVFINFIAIALSISLKDNLTLVASNYIDDRLLGNFSNRNSTEKYLSYAVFLFLMIWCFLRSAKFKVVITDTMIAEQLGLKVKLLNLEMIFISSCLTAVSYIMGGNVLFLGIAAANLGYAVFGNRFSSSIIFSSFITIIFLIFGQFILDNIVQNLTSLVFDAPIVTPLLVAPIFTFIILFKNNI
ncbi:iron ABC transporter permease [Ureaplasma parvum]|uniref:Ferrichrome ABC transporter n=2 Tax=Ureaplasma parvum serovar 3 TaxID=38504 RepID=Q9PQD3_UREPA|nr:iron ABC transporter permease [Ureaplasma parvum]pir/F82902/ ferrichrome ABC transporter UU358 [imported] - Ureaplasma urealyticum [Ureaplasma urealyticum]AAF30767.1 ferrichrome ABC transporter [Ureaplasma parvum serovar 3 str. ATCC 700970]ACA33110.1 ferrichrome ABC transporter [Ureaplasma parvum serovar 3 str. ATCC 27815]ASD24323.1 iron ABC transporter permease [Ureaplasma parvum]ASD25390.1 iron ABC transporter permease [Ureaplasma parvum]ASD28710.1 iron ABC transporter permease [Ureaplas